ncbi:MAG: PepSY domain-containing protein [bacterium]
MKQPSRIVLSAAVVAATLTALPAFAQATKAAMGEKHESMAQEKHETRAQLKAQTKIKESAARITALAKVPGGRVKSSELEREKGKLIYSFDIATKGKSGIDEVQVDAITGDVVGGVEHESPKAERKEAAAEKKEAKAAAKKP